MEEARPATAADVPRLAALSEMARAEVAGQRGGALLLAGMAGGPRVAELVAAAQRDPDRIAVVGTTYGAEVGFVSAHCDRTSSPPLGVIDVIYVEPAARMVGVGEAMIDLVVAWCARRGCAGVDAPALPGSRATKAFFEDTGFVTRLLVMHHPLLRADG
jgi:GNAT superfamily N-acetyltransferase